MFVAHNARFDHGFLKHEFARVGRPFSARPLCTVRLSRRLFPGCAMGTASMRSSRATASRSPDRHRALGDARALWAFVQALYREFPQESIAAAVKRILRIPSLPPQLPPDALDRLPESPGVYLFYGDNPLPIYIGKSINLRDRVAAHFPATGAAKPTCACRRRSGASKFEETAGELGALLREAKLVKTVLPAHNRALRRKEEAGVLVLDDGVPRFVRARDRARGARRMLRSVRIASAAHAKCCARSRPSTRLCWRRLGLEKRAERTLLSAPAEALRRRVRGRRIARRARCASAQRAWRACAIPGMALCRTRRWSARQRTPAASAWTCT